MNSNLKTEIKTLSQFCVEKEFRLSEDWEIKLLQYDDNLSYLVSNRSTLEAIWIDPVLESFEEQKKESAVLQGYRFLAVIDTHTHADHLSNAGELARFLGAPLIMDAHAPSQGVQLRVSQDTVLSTAAGPLQLLRTPGHTWDSITPIWGPFVFTGDTILFGDTGRDDLPTGNPTQHYESLLKIKAALTPKHLMLSGHDQEGRASSWAYQLENNFSLMQPRDDFIRDASAYTGPAPKLLKESLFHNFK